MRKEVRPVTASVYKNLRVATSSILVLGILLAPIAQTGTVLAARPGNAGTPNANANARAFEATSQEKAFGPWKVEEVKDKLAEKKEEKAHPKSNKTKVLPAVSEIKNQSKPKTARPQKVTICHRTNSVTNPYVRITVSTSAVDGNRKNDHSHHEGPVATSQKVAQELKDQKIKWGDIIPPVTGVNPGQNWNDDGRTVYNNGCKPAKPVVDQEEDKDDGDVLGDKDKPGKGGVEEKEEGEVLSTSAVAKGPGALPQTGASSLLSIFASLFSALMAGTYTWNRERRKAQALTS